MKNRVDPGRIVYTFALFAELAYATGRNAHFMRFYGIRPNFLPDPAKPHETSVYKKLQKYSAF